MIRVPAGGPLPARYMIVGESPGADEERHTPPAPFVGRSGKLLDAMLAEAGIPRGACYVTNVVKYRPPENKLEDKGHAWLTESKGKAAKFGCGHFADGLYYNDLVAEGLAELPGEIDRCNPEVIIALGNAALWALTTETGIGKWRGSELWWKGARLGGPGSIPVIPTYHPAFVLRVHEWRAACVRDFKLRVQAKMGKPEAREMPPYRFTVAQSTVEANSALMRLWRMADCGPLDLTCDVETSRRHRRMLCVGFGWSPLDALCIPLMHVDGRRFFPENEEANTCNIIKGLMNHPNVRLINQNFNYDRQWFYREPLFAFRPSLHYDTMIGQHLLYPGMPKDLSYQSSLYCKWHRFWKDEGKEIEVFQDEKRVMLLDEDQEWRYNCRDCVVTWEVAAMTRPMLVKAGFAGKELL